MLCQVELDQSMNPVNLTEPMLQDQSFGSEVEFVKLPAKRSEIAFAVSNPCCPQPTLPHALNADLMRLEIENDRVVLNPV